MTTSKNKNNNNVPYPNFIIRLKKTYFEAQKYR